MVSQDLDQARKANAFQALHQRQGGFVIPNPWDAGTARILSALGYEALSNHQRGAGLRARPPRR